ncbi:hypothetical protein DV965_17280 [Staphylococcus pseudintermedius]|nr:hypothetical protein DV965_17280 [Staphylococcus pseudintermedius]
MKRVNEKGQHWPETFFKYKIDMLYDEIEVPEWQKRKQYFNVRHVVITRLNGGGHVLLLLPGIQWRNRMNKIVRVLNTVYGRNKHSQHKYSSTIK